MNLQFWTCFKDFLKNSIWTRGLGLKLVFSLVFLKLFSFCMPEAGYFPNKNFKIDHCGGLHHSLKSVSTALTTSSMRRKIRILLGNPVHAWRARVHTAAFSSYIGYWPFYNFLFKFNFWSNVLVRKFQKKCSVFNSTKKQI